ncbi:MAG: helix-turn-helix transcriptional regulator [Paracoccaceae bacterium]
MIDTLLSAREAAKILNCGTSTVWRRAAEGVIPRPLKIGGTSRWKLSDLEAVIAKAEAHREAA